MNKIIDDGEILYMDVGVEYAHDAIVCKPCH